SDVSLILFTRDSVPDLRCIREVCFGLIEQSGKLLQTLDDLSKAPVEGRVVQDRGNEDGIPRQFHIYRRIVFVALDGVQVEQVQIQIVFHVLQIRLFFLTEGTCVPPIYAHLEILIELALRIHAGGTEVVEHFVELDSIVLVISRLRRTHRGEGKAAVKEIVGELLKIRAAGRRAARRRSGFLAAATGA